jgi:cytochrome c553
MPHPMSFLAAAAPLLALAVQATAPAPAARAHAAATLPNNLCASCHGHGGGRVVSLAADHAGLDARELAATRAYLQAAQGG